MRIPTVKITRTTDGGWLEREILPLNPEDEIGPRTVQKLEYRFYDRELHLVKREISWIYDEKCKMKI